MSSRALDLGLAANSFVTVLPDLSSLPNVGDVLSVKTVSGGMVATGFNAPSGMGAFLPLTGGTMTGPLILSGDPTAGSNVNQAATKHYVDAAISGIGTFVDAPSDTFSYGRLNGAWTRVLPLAGGAMTGPLTGNTTFGGSGTNALTIRPGASSTAGIWLQQSGTGGVYVPGQLSSDCFYGLGGGTLTLAGAQTTSKYGLLVSGNLAGSGASGAAANYITFTTDTVSLPPGSQGLSWFCVNGKIGGGIAMSGSRAAANFTAYYVGPTSSTSDGDRQWQASIQTFQASASAGGTTPHIGSSGGWGYSGGDQAWLLSGSTNWSGIVGREIDVAINTGSSASSRLGLHVVSYGNLQGTEWDQAVSISTAGSAPGWLYGVGLGSKAVDPTNGVIVGYQAGPPNYAEPAPKAFRGIDLSAYLFTDSAYRAAGGFVVDGGGAVNVSSAKLSVTNAGQAQLDVPGQAITAVAINNGGTGYVVGDQLRGPYGTVVTVGTISGGMITGIAVNVYGGTTQASPSTTAVPFVGGSGGGNALFNLTFTAVGGSLALQPSGGPVTVNAGCTITSGSAAPAAAQPAGSIYMRTGGASGARLYVSAGTGAWTAVAGV